MAIDPPSFQSLKDAAKAEIQSVDPTLTDFTEGSNLDAITATGAFLAQEAGEYALRLFRSGLVRYATDEELVALALEVYGLTPLEPTKSVGEVFWTEDAASGYTIPAGTTLTGTAPDGTAFTAVTLHDATSNNPSGIAVEASTAGAAGNVPAGTLTAVSGFATDPGATVSQPSRMAGGADDESPDHLRKRLLLYFPSLSKGVASAVELAALSVYGVEYVYTTVVDTNLGPIARVYVADSTGAGNGTLASLVQDTMAGVVALGAYPEVLAAAREEPTLTCTMVVKKASDVPRAEALARTVLLDACNAVSINDSWFASDLERVVHNAYPNVLSVEVRFNGALVAEKAVSSLGNTLRLLDGNLTVTATERAV